MPVSASHYNWFSPFICFVALSVTASQTRLQAQDRPAADPPATRKPVPGSTKQSTTLIDIELITVDGGGIHAQQWKTILEPTGVSLRIHAPLPGDKPEITEKQLGTIRRVTAVGTLERNGEVRFPGQAFRPNEAAAVAEWIRELESYGAQGKPDGQPLWGLSNAQFEGLYEAVSTPAKIETVDQTIDQVLSKLNLPSTYPLQWTIAAQKLVNKQQKLVSPAGRFAKATCLAMSLRELELGWRPARSPEGRIEIEIDNLSEGGEFWPIGWPPQKLRPQLAPKFFTLLPLRFKESTLAELIDTIESAAEIPILLDNLELGRDKIDPAEIKVDYRPRQASYSVALRTLVAKARLVREIYQDEAGQPFVWVTTARSARREGSEP
jgi:hypothetical protein